MLRSTTSSVTRTPRPAPEPDPQAPLAQVVHLGAWRPDPAEQPLHITAELLAALAGTWPRETLAP